MSTIITNDKGPVVTQLESFTRFLVNEMTVFNVNEEGFVVDSDNELVTVKSGKKEYRVSTYTDLVKGDDILILNPTNESIANQTADKIWLYEMLAVGLVAKVAGYIKYISSFDSDNADPEAIDLVSRYVADIPDKFLDEFMKLAKTSTNFINVWAGKSNLATLRCIIFEKQFDNVKMAKGSKAILTKMIKDLFETEDMSEYTMKPVGLKAPQLDATLRLYHKIYSTLNKSFNLLTEDDSVDVIALEGYIEKIPLFADKSKWLVQTMAKPESSVQTQAADIILRPRGTYVPPVHHNHQGPVIVQSPGYDNPGILRPRGAGRVSYPTNYGYKTTGPRIV